MKLKEILNSSSVRKWLAGATLTAAAFAYGCGGLHRHEEPDLPDGDLPEQQCPDIAPLSDYTVEEGENLRVAAEVEGFDNSELSWMATGLPRGASFDDGVLDWTPDENQAGEYSIAVSARVPGCSDTETLNVHVRDGNNCPVMADYDNFTVAAGERVSFPIIASDPDGDELTYSALDMPSGANFDADSGVFSWTPTRDQAGQHDVTFTASDGQCPDSTTVGIAVVDETFPLEAHLAAAPEVISEGEAFRYSCMTFGGEEPRSVTMEFGDGTSSAEADGTHRLDAPGMYTVTCDVTDARGDTDSDSLEITVLDNVPECDVAVTPTSGTVPLAVDIVGSVIGGNAPFIYTIAVTDGTDVYLTEGDTALGMEIVEAGDYTVEFTVVDNDGDMCRDTTTLTVDPEPPACSNGLDDDGDGLVDDADPGCVNDMDNEEEDPEECEPLDCSADPETAYFERSGDILTLNEFLGDVVETMDSSDAPNGLGTYTLTTSLGTTHVNQYLRFNWGSGSTADRTYSFVTYAKDDDDNVGDFLWFRDGEEVFRWESEFVEGLESSIAADGTLTDLLMQTLNILGEEFMIYGANKSPTTDSVTLEMMASPAMAVLNSDDVSYMCHGTRSHVVTTSGVDTLENSVRLTIDGEVTRELHEGETEMLSDGTIVMVGEITPVGPGHEIEVYMTDRTLRIRDSTAAAHGDATIEVTEENIEDADGDIEHGMTSSGDFRLNRLSYTLFADGIRGDEPYVPAGNGVAAYLDEPEGMLSEHFDISYLGFEEYMMQWISLLPVGRDEIRLGFVNTQGVGYSHVRLAYVNGSGLMYGDDSNALVFEQGDDVTGPSQYTIHEDYYFVVSHNGDSDTGVTRVLRLDGVDTISNLLQMTDAGTGSSINGMYTGVAPECAPGVSGAEGTFNVGGYTFDYVVCLVAGSPRVMVDLDDDGSIGGEARVVVQGGGIIDLGSQSIADARLPVAGSNIEMTLTTLRSNMDEASDDEVIYFGVSGDTATSTIDAYVVDSLMSADGLRMYTHEAPDDHLRSGMSTYGAYVVIGEDPLDPSAPREVEIEYPTEQLRPLVRVEFDDCE